ncbi:MAG: hypothetical protein WC497_03240 [Patescibacteria group bacterium]
MSTVLNDSLYKRFGLEIDLEEVQSGFCMYTKNVLLDYLSPIISPEIYNNTSILKEIQTNTLTESCRQLFKDPRAYYSYDNFIKRIFDINCISFEKYLINLQIFINVLFNYKQIRPELNQVLENLSNYLIDYPILNIALKIYKSKPAQILPSISKTIDLNIENTLNILETIKYKPVLINYEEGLKEFLLAKTQSQLKDVVEDMLTACDELAKIALKDKNKGFKHFFKNSDNYFKNRSTKELYRNLKDWMDSIKHGSLKDFDRMDIETIINAVSSFIRLMAK